VASAGGKSSAGLIEVQPGATCFFQEKTATDQELFSRLHLTPSTRGFPGGKGISRTEKGREIVGKYAKFNRCNLFGQNGLHLIRVVE
jgi:hypothetical protein